MNTALIFLTISAICSLLLLLYLLSNLSSNSNKESKITAKTYPPIRDNNLIGDAGDWVILYYYTPTIFNWVRGKKHLTEADKASCYQLRQKLQTSCEWLSKDGKMYTGMPTSDYDGIRIMNKHNNDAYIVSWSGNDVIVGTRIEKGSNYKFIWIFKD